MYLGSKKKQEELWEDMRSKRKSTKEGNNKVTSEDEGIRGKDFVNKSFIWKEQLVGNCSLVDSVNIYSVDIWSIEGVSRFFSWESSFFL